jgi:hypothetical protein
MTIRTFWTIFIKILGIYLVVDSIGVVTQSISSLFYTNRFDNSPFMIVLSITSIALTLGIYIAILRLCVFKPEWLISKLKLDKGFTEERLDLNISSSTALSVAAIIIGGLLFIDSLSLLAIQLFSYFKNDNLSSVHVQDNPSTKWILIYGLKTILGYWIVKNYQVIANVIGRKDKENN